MSLRSDFLAFDDLLAQRGVPPLTAWWRDGVGHWLDAYETGHVLELWACVGRGAAKSTALYKLATFFTLFGDFAIPPGERHFAIVLSRLKEEAAKGINIIDAWLTLLSIGHRLAGDVIELTDKPRGIRVVAASVAASSGWRAYFVAKDERSKWPTGGVDELDAAEVDTSASAMTATHEFAPVVGAGSAWGRFGPFYEAVIGGTDSTKVVLGPAPTWVAAPHISIESTQRKERDPRRWAREYKCEFQAGALGAFNPDDIDAAIRDLPMGLVPCSAPIIITDASAGRGDAWTWCAACWCRGAETSSEHRWMDLVLRRGQRILVRQSARELGDEVLHERAMVERDATTHAMLRNPSYRETSNLKLVISDIHALTGRFADDGIASGDVVGAIAATAKMFRARRVHGDQYSQYALAESFSRNKLAYVSTTWTNELKVQAVAHLRTWLRDRVLLVSAGAEADKLREELLLFEEKLLPSGYISFGARRGGHDDRVALLMLAAAIDIQGGFGGASPARPGRYRYEVPRGLPGHEY